MRVLLVVLLAFLALASATDRYVRTNCAGAPTPCYTNFYNATSFAAAGDVIYVGSGTHNVANYANLAVPLTIVGETFPGAIINCTTSSYGLYSDDAIVLNLMNLTFTYCPTALGLYGQISVYMRDVKFTNNEYAIELYYSSVEGSGSISFSNNGYDIYGYYGSATFWNDITSYRPLDGHFYSDGALNGHYMGSLTIDCGWKCTDETVYNYYSTLTIAEDLTISRGSNYALDCEEANCLIGGNFVVTNVDGYALYSYEAVVEVYGDTTFTNSSDGVYLEEGSYYFYGDLTVSQSDYFYAEYGALVTVSGASSFSNSESGSACLDLEYGGYFQSYGPATFSGCADRAIYIYEAGAYFDSTFTATNNRHTSDGCVYMEDSSLWIVGDVLFSNNNCTSTWCDSAGIYIDYGGLQTDGTVTISNNEAYYDTAFYNYGGGWIANGPVYFTDNYVRNTDDTIGYFYDSGTVFYDDLVVTGNSAKTGTDSSSVAVYVEYSGMTFWGDVVIDGNSKMGAFYGYEVGLEVFGDAYFTNNQLSDIWSGVFYHEYSGSNFWGDLYIANNTNTGPNAYAALYNDYETALNIYGTLTLHNNKIVNGPGYGSAYYGYESVFNTHGPVVITGNSGSNATMFFESNAGWYNLGFLPILSGNSGSKRADIWCVGGSVMWANTSCPGNSFCNTTQCPSYAIGSRLRLDAASVSFTPGGSATFTLTLTDTVDFELRIPFLFEFDDPTTEELLLEHGLTVSDSPLKIPAGASSVTFTVSATDATFLMDAATTFTGTVHLLSPRPYGYALFDFTESPTWSLSVDATTTTTTTTTTQAPCSASTLWSFAKWFL